MKKGDTIVILQMEDKNGLDTQATRMNGETYTVDFIDDTVFGIFKLSGCFSESTRHLWNTFGSEKQQNNKTNKQNFTPTDTHTSPHFVFRRG